MQAADGKNGVDVPQGLSVPHDTRQERAALDRTPAGRDFPAGHPQNASGRKVVTKVCRPADGPSKDGVRVCLDPASIPRLFELAGKGRFGEGGIATKELRDLAVVLPRDRWQ